MIAYYKIIINPEKILISYNNCGLQKNNFSKFIKIVDIEKNINLL